jgi:hypothetical protein
MWVLSCLLIAGVPALAGAEDAASSQSKQAVQKSTRSERAREVGEKSFDAVVLRPLQSVVVVAGTVLFVPAAAMSSPGGLPLIEEAWDYFVVVRYEDAWTRRLGEF